MIKVDRTPTPPASLAIEKRKASGSYQTEDVVDLLRSDFQEKCYLCERKPVSDINIEHLIPHKGNVDLKFDWNNLFYSCAHCNSVKNKDKYDNKILDCCREEPEQFLNHIFEGEHVRVVPIEEDCTNDRILLTAELITACFESTYPAIRTIQCEVRVNELRITMLTLYKKLNEYSRNPQGRAICSLRGMLDRSYKFAGFTRTYVRLHLKDYPGLASYIE